MSELDGWLSTLGLERGASFDDIRAAYRDLAKIWHPDRFQNDPRLKDRADLELKAVNDAFANIERFVQGGGQLPSVRSSGGSGTPPVRKRDPHRDTWTIRPPLQMQTDPVPDRRRIRNLLSILGTILLIGGVVAALAWQIVVR